MSRRPIPPSYRHHKARNCAVVTINGKNQYLGPYGSAQSHEKYSRLVAEWLANGRQLLPAQKPDSRAEQPFSVNELLVAYWHFAEKYYQHDGKPTKELMCMKHAMRPLKELYGLTAAADFGPKALKAVREHMVSQGLCRRMVNARVNRIRRIFKWATSEELIPPTVLEGLRSVSGLRYGRTSARESEPVKPVDVTHVEAILPFVSPPVAAMIRLQLLTGMRAAEIVQMRPCDIDRSEPVWLYRPASHKGSHLGHEKIVPLGPQAQAVLQPFLGRPTESFLFSPKEAVGWRVEQRAVQRNPERKTPVYPCELKAREKRKAASRSRIRKRPLRDRYDVDSYRRAITYGIRKANRERLKADPAAVEIPHWHPHQLRHTRATAIRQRYGLEGAQVALGHQKADVSQIYAERDLRLAVRIASEAG